MSFQACAHSLLQANNILISTHILPDGDGVGSQLALYHSLKKQGKNVRIINVGRLPSKFSGLAGAKNIESFGKQIDLKKIDLAVVLDTHEVTMLGPLGAELQKAQVKLLFIDHHSANLTVTPEGSVIDESYGSTGELVFALLKHAHFPIPLETASAVYAAMMTDLGTFRFRRSSSQSHRVASELLEMGVASDQIFQSIYGTDSLGKVRLLGKVLENAQSSNGGKLAWLTLSVALRKKYGASVEDTESFLNQLVVLKDVEIAMLFREDSGGIIKLSLRGPRTTAVLDIARQFGGGGHTYAAGARIKGKLAQVQRQVLEAARKACRKTHAAQKKPAQ